MTISHFFSVVKTSPLSYYLANKKDPGGSRGPLNLLICLALFLQGIRIGSVLGRLAVKIRNHLLRWRRYGHRSFHDDRLCVHVLFIDALIAIIVWTNC